MLEYESVVAFLTSADLGTAGESEDEEGDGAVPPLGHESHESSGDELDPCPSAVVAAVPSSMALPPWDSSEGSSDEIDILGPESIVDVQHAQPVAGAADQPPVAPEGALALPKPKAKPKPKPHVAWCHGVMPRPSQRSLVEHKAITMGMRLSKRAKELEALVKAAESEDEAPQHEHCLSDEQRVALACTRAISLDTIANKYDVSTRTAREMFMSVALASLIAQTAWMADVLRRLIQNGINMSWDRLKMDETLQMLTMEVTDTETDMPAGAHKLSWSVLVQHRVVGWQNVDETVEEYKLHMLPTIMISSKNAGCYHDALVTQLSVRRAVAFVKCLRALAAWSLALRESDDAAVVKKVCAEEAVAMLPNSNVFVEDLSCGLHQQNILTGGIVKLHFDETVAAKWHYSGIQREGNYFMRQVLAVSRVADGVPIRRKPPSALKSKKRNALS